MSRSTDVEQRSQSFLPEMTLPSRLARFSALAAFLAALRAAFASSSPSDPSEASLMSSSDPCRRSSLLAAFRCFLRSVLQALLHVVTSSQQFSHCEAHRAHDHTSIRASDERRFGISVVHAFFRHVNGRLHCSHVFTGKLCGLRKESLAAIAMSGRQRAATGKWVDANGRLTARSDAIDVTTSAARKFFTSAVVTTCAAPERGVEGRRKEKEKAAKAAERKLPRPPRCVS